MDNLSHAVFGGSIVHALWGKRYGAKATTYALFASNLPDIDIVLRFIPWIDPLQAGFAHRTLTHSLLFAVIISPILGRIMARWMKTGKQSWKDRSLITLVCILSHIFLDRCTTYGIWFLWPFSHIGFESRIISVVDIFYTLPLLGIVIWYLSTSRKKHHHSYIRRGRTRFIGVCYAFGYLCMMAITQYNVQQSIAHDMQQASVQYTRIFAAPGLLQPFLRYGIVELPDGSYKTTYTSFFDTKPRIYENVYGYHDRIAGIGTAREIVDDLIERAHGRYQIDSEGNNYIFRDMRFGRMLGWDTERRGPYMFAYTINPTEGNDMYIKQRGQKSLLPFSELWSRYWNRVRGN